MRFCRLSLRHEGVLRIGRLVVSLFHGYMTFCKECRLWSRWHWLCVLWAIILSLSLSPTQSVLPFCAGVQFSRDSIRVFNDRIRETWWLWLWAVGADLGIFLGGNPPLRNGVTEVLFCKLPVILESRMSSLGGEVHPPWAVWYWIAFLLYINKQLYWIFPFRKWRGRCYVCWGNSSTTFKGISQGKLQRGVT